MLKHIINSRTLMVILFTLVFYSLFGAPPKPTHLYSPSSWAYPLKTSGFRSDSKPDSAFYGYSIIRGSTEPMYGYPFHSGFTKDVNDTLVIKLILENRNDDPVPLKNESPETWVVPLVYNSYYNLARDIPFADTSDFSYQFQYYQNTALGLNKPDSLYDLDKFKPDNNCAVVFYLWNLPLGPKVIEMKKTSLAPDEFVMLKSAGSQYLYCTPKDIIDTLNAYASMCRRSMDRLNSTAALAWTDSMFALNDSSIAGWKWRSQIYHSLHDSTNTLDCLNRVISIINNNSDPLVDLADTTINPEYQNWASDIKTGSELLKYVVETG